MLLDRRQFLATAAAAALVPAVAHAAAPSALARARGVNIPGWLDRLDGTAPSDEVLDRLMSLGLTTLRLPVDGELVGNRDIERRIHDALDLLEARGFATILDMHPQEAMRTLLEHDPAEAGNALTTAWDVLSTIAANHSSDRVALELLNEPPLEAADWLPLRNRLAEAVRRHAPRHTIVWGASRYQGIWETLEQSPLADDNAIAAVHYYWPIGFTHQCQNWDASPTARIGDLPFPAAPDDPRVLAVRHALEQAGDSEALATLDTEFASPWADDHIAADFADLAAWSARTGVPAIVNEFGVLDSCVDAQSRAHWTRAVRRAAEASGIGWAYWELDQGFGLMADRADASSFDGSMIEALVA